MLKTDTGNDIEVHLGPAWYIDNQEAMLNEGDQISVTGSRITYQNREVIIVSVIQKDEMELRLRDKQGIPYWNAWRN